MMAEIHGVYLFQRKSLRVTMFKMMLGTYREFFKLHLRDLLQMFNATIAKPKVYDLKYFMEQMLLAKQDEAGVTLTDEQNDSCCRCYSDEEYEQLHVNSGSVEYDNNVQASYELEQLARNAYREAEKQKINAKKLSVVELKRQSEELQKTQTTLKRKMSENEDKYHDTVLDLKAKVKDNENVVFKIGRSLQEMFMLGPKPMSFYDSNLKHGLGYANPYTLKKAISHNPKLYDASCFSDSKIRVNVRDTEDILDDATKSQKKMENKLNDPVAIEKKQNFCPIDYNKLNALYEDFVSQKELYSEQKYFSSTFIPFENSSNASTETKPFVALMPIDIKEIKDVFDSTESAFNATWKDNELLNDQLLEEKIKHEIHEKERRKFESSLKTVCETSWISKMEKLENENGLSAVSSVRRPLNKDSPLKNSVLSNTKKSSEKVEVSLRSNKKTYVKSKNVVSNKKIVTDVDVQYALKAKDVLCVSCAKNVLILCHDKCLANYKLNMHSKVRRALFTTPKTAKSAFEDTTPIVSKTRFSLKTTHSKSLDTTFVVSTTKIAAVTPLSAKNKVVQIILWIVDSGCSKHMTGYGDYVQDNITIFHVYYVEGLGHNRFSVGQFYDDMAASSPVCLLSKATSTKSWLWHHRLSHLNFGTINDLTKHDLVDGLPKFKYSKDHLCSIYERGKNKKSSHPPKLVPNTHSKLEFLHVDLCEPMRVATINEKKYILVIFDDYSRFTWVYFLHTKDETPEIIKKFISQVQLNYNAKVYKIRTDTGTEFKNATLKAHYENLGIMQ
ncbi:integrase, catalytic region, zinc finger, CCHC-type containing protein [Tanacetum coccineum]